MSCSRVVDTAGGLVVDDAGGTALDAGVFGLLVDDEGGIDVVVEVTRVVEVDVDVEVVDEGDEEVVDDRIVVDAVGGFVVVDEAGTVVPGVVVPGVVDPGGPLPSGGSNGFPHLQRVTGTAWSGGVDPGPAGEVVVVVVDVVVDGRPNPRAEPADDDPVPLSDGPRSTSTAVPAGSSELRG